MEVRAPMVRASTRPQPVKWSTNRSPLSRALTFNGGGVICQAAQPTDLNKAPTGTATSYISAYKVLGTFAAATADNGVGARIKAILRRGKPLPEPLVVFPMVPNAEAPSSTL